VTDRTLKHISACHTFSCKQYHVQYHPETVQLIGLSNGLQFMTSVTMATAVMKIVR